MPPSGNGPVAPVISDSAGGRRNHPNLDRDLRRFCVEPGAACVLDIASARERNPHDRYRGKSEERSNTVAMTAGETQTGNRRLGASGAGNTQPVAAATPRARIVFP